MAEFEKNPALYTAMLGNKSVVISPCQRPPSQKAVKEWLRGKTLYKKAKEQEELAKQRTPKDKVGGKHIAKTTAHKSTKPVHEMSPSPPEESANVSAIDKSLGGSFTEEPSTSISLDDSAIESDIIPPSPETKRPSSVHPRQIVGSQMSSTPARTPSMRSTAKSPLIVSPITPKPDKDTSYADLTPSTSFRKPRPPRRSSSDQSQASLRRVLLNTQLKVRF